MEQKLFQNWHSINTECQVKMHWKLLNDQGNHFLDEKVTLLQRYTDTHRQKKNYNFLTFPSIHTSNIALYNIWELLFWKVMSAACTNSSSKTVLLTFYKFLFFFYRHKFTLVCRSNPKYCRLWLWAPKCKPIPPWCMLNSPSKEK